MNEELTNDKKLDGNEESIISKFSNDAGKEDEAT